MMAAERIPGPFDRLPPVRGRYGADARLADLTWLRVGGPADVLFTPADGDDLAEFLAGCPSDIPVIIIGAGSNLLVRDGGVRGVVVRPGRGMTGLSVEKNNTIRVGAGVPCKVLAREAMRAGLAGFEFMIGIPGNVGGALRMNAGAHESDTAGILHSAVALDRRGERHVLPVAEMGYSYRDCAAVHGHDGGLLFTEAVFRGSPESSDAIAARMKAVRVKRGEAQPSGAGTGGSTFKNPPGDKAWRLIDAAGLRESSRGGARLSPQHCNFLLNTGTASAADLEGLGEDVRAGVHRVCGVELEWEIRRMGDAS